TRAALFTITALLAAACFVPAIARPAGGTAPSWSVWVTAVAYAPLTGMMWPLVEGRLAARRSGRNLRRAVGAFNIAWASAMIAAYFAMAPLVRSAPLQVLTWLGVCHLLSLVVIARLASDRRVDAETRERAPHEDDAEPDAGPDAEQVAARSRRRATTFRVLLPASYVAMAVLDPILASSLARLGVSEPWRPALVATWLVTRLVAFMTLHLWHGWHRARFTPHAATIGLLTSMAAVLLLPFTATGATAIGGMLLALGVLGVAQGAVYKGALYYALEHSEHKVDTGGRHEALIGVGYTIGPLLGILAFGLDRGEGLLGSSILVALLWTTTLGALAIAALRGQPPESRPVQSIEPS
ncbi:MAG: hypothetical protein AAFU70_11045, partial [Planctomycetota bacterium]